MVVAEDAVEAVAPTVIARTVVILEIDDSVVAWTGPDEAEARNFLSPMRMLPIPPNK